MAGLRGVFRSKVWDPRRPIEEAAFVSGKTMRQSIRPTERWRDGIARRHQFSIFPDDHQQLFECQFADIVVTYGAPAAHPHEWQAIDELAKALSARLLVHDHNHENIDHVARA